MYVCICVYDDPTRYIWSHFLKMFWLFILVPVDRNSSYIHLFELPFVCVYALAVVGGKKNSTIFNVQYIMNAMCRLYNFVVRSFVRSSCCQLSSIIPHQLDFILAAAAAAAFDVVIVFNHQKL